MASATVARLTDASAPVPSMGTLPCAANQLVPKGTIVTRNATGYAVSPSSADASGFPAVGVSNATYNNQTGAEAGGLDGSLDIELCFGVYGFDISGSTPLVGDVLYVVDNQTVSTSSNGGLRGVAGVCVEVREMNGVSQAFCAFGPHFASEGVGAGARLIRSIPLTSLRLSTGAAIPAFSNGSADGFALVDSEAMGLRINDDSTTVFVATVDLVDHDDTQDLVLHMTGFRVGSSDATGVSMTVGAFFHTLGAAHTADANAGGSTTEFTAATTIVSEETLTIAAEDVPAGPCTLTLTFQVAAALDDDDLVLLGLWLAGAKK